MNARLTFLIFVFLAVSYRCYIQFSNTIGERLVTKLQEHFEEIECPSGISLYRLQRDGVLFRVQIQTRLPHNPYAKHRIVRRCETLRPLSSTRVLFSNISHSPLESDQLQYHITSSNLSSNSYLNVDAWMFRLLHESCDRIDYETRECGLSDGDKDACVGKEAPPKGIIDFLFEALNRPNTFQADEQQTMASETWSIQTLTKGIFPGTLWCGFGNIADDTMGKLGEHSETDDCCRSHDLCKPIIKAFETRYSYSNPSLVPISHCACDMAFYNCLLRVNSPTSRMIGRVFFNLARMKCFDFDLKYVCTSSVLGLCWRRGDRCVAVVKQNKLFPV